MINIKNLRNGKPKNNYDVRVDRQSVLGNPFFMKSENERDLVCDKYEQYFHNKIKTDSVFKDELDRLITIYKAYGKLNLFCWCAPKRCHAETIRKYIESII